MPTLQQVLRGALGASAPGYPTKEQIIGTPHTHKPEVIKLVKLWKKEVWFPLRNQGPSDKDKFEALKALIQRIAEEAYQKPVEVDYEAEVMSCYYQPDRNRIVINKSLSILSSLHELAHHLFGPSELKACRWSVWLFKKTFKKAYSQLEWRGHMLVKPRVCSVS